MTSTPVTTLAHMPATHNTLYEDTYRKAGQRYESSEEDSGFSDYSGESTSDGRMSPETSGELPTRRLPGRSLTRGPSVERPAGKKQLKRKAKPKISPADTGGRDADLPAPSGLSAKSADTPVTCPPQADESVMSADTPMDPVAQVGLSAKSADTPTACLPQADESTTSADTLTVVQAAPGDTLAPLKGMPGTPEEATATAAHADDMAGLPEGMPGTPEEVTATAAHADDMAGFPEGMPSTPEEVTATAAHADDMAGFPDGMLCKPEDVTTTADAADSVADTSDSVADTSDGVADTPDDGADSQEDGQVDFGLPLSALQAGIKEEGQLKEDAATTTGRRAAPSSSAAVASPSSLVRT